MQKDQHALKAVIKGAAISTTGVFISQYILSPIIGILNTRILGVETYGLFALASNVIGLISMFPLLGMHEGIIKFVPVYLLNNQIEKVKGALFFSIRVTTLLGVICFLICLGLTNYLANYFFKKPDLALILYLASITIILNTYQYLFAGFFAALKDIKIRTLIKYIYPNVSKLIILIMVFFWGGGIIGVMGAVLTASWVQAISGWIHARKLFPPLTDQSIHPVFEKTDRREFFLYSTPLYLVIFFDVILQQTDGVMIGYFCSAADVGIYEVSFRFTPFLLLALGSTAQMFQPIISDYFARNETSKIELLYKQVTYIIIVVTLPIAVSFLIYPEELLMLFGYQFRLGENILRILTIGFLLQVSFGHTAAILALSGKPRVIFFNNSLITVFNVFLNYILIQLWGSIGAAVATSLSFMLSGFFLWLLVYKYFRFIPFSIRIWKPFFSALVTGLLFLWIHYHLKASNIHYLWIILSITGLFVFYFAMLLALKLSAEEKTMIIEFKNKLLSKTGIFK